MFPGSSSEGHRSPVVPGYPLPAPSLRLGPHVVTLPEGRTSLYKLNNNDLSNRNRGNRKVHIVTTVEIRVNLSLLEFNLL